MFKDDDKLQEELRNLELGGGLSTSKLEGEHGSEELTSLVKLAASIRGLPHPEQDLMTMNAEKRKLMTAAQARKRGQKRAGWSRNGGFTGQWMVFPAVAGAALIIFMIFVFAAGAGIYFSGPRGAQAAVLTEGSGVLEVSDGGGSGEWVAVSNGDRVKSGQRLRTGADSQVTLTFFDGTQVNLDSNTDLMLSQVDGDWGRELKVALIQNEGMTSHQVVPLQGTEAAYNVMTPSGEASVRGTSFNVLVEETGDSVFSVETGAVLVSNNGDEAFLAAGQGVITELGKPLAGTSYLFALYGQLTDNTGKTWAVEDISFTMKGGTRIDVGLQEGVSSVLVTGRITNKNEWIADSVLAYETDSAGGTFTGIVTSLSEGAIEVDDMPLVLPEGLFDVNLGDLVRVQFTIQEGSWVVDNLEVLVGGDASEPDPEPAPDTEEPDEPGTDLYFASEEDKVTVCGQGEPFENTLYYVSDDVVALDLEVYLEATVEEGVDYVSDVLINPDSTFTIQRSSPDQLEKGVDFTVTVQLNTDTLPPETEIEVKIELKYASTGELTGDVYKIKLECDEELPEDQEQDDTDGDGDKCTREKQHPHALTLEAVYGERVGVDYEKIWTWFCVYNLGFGEIEQAFKLTIEYGEVLGLDVDDIIEMRLEGGLGWGQIKQELKHAEIDLLGDEASDKKVPPGKEKSEEAKNKDKPKKKDE